MLHKKKCMIFNFLLLYSKIRYMTSAIITAPYLVSKRVVQGASVTIYSNTRRHKIRSANFFCHSLNVDSSGKVLYNIFVISIIQDANLRQDPHRKDHHS